MVDDEKDSMKAAYSQALAYYEKGSYSAALEILQKIVLVLKENLAIMNLAGVCHLRLGGFGKAVTLFKLVLNRDPININALNNLGMAYQELGRWGDSITVLNKALLIDPGKSESRINLANAQRGSGLYQDAEDNYLEVLKNNDCNTDALNNYALLLKEIGRFDEATDYLLRALRVDPHQPDALINLGRVEMDRGNNDEAEVHFKQAINREISNPEAHYNLGLWYMLNRRAAEAFECFKRTLALSPRHVNALNNIGNLFREIGKMDEAERAFRQVCDLKPNDPNLMNNLAVILLQKGEYKEAEQVFRKVLAEAPRFGHAIGQVSACARARYDWRNYYSDEKRIIESIEEGVKGVPSLIAMGLVASDKAMYSRKMAKLSIIDKVKIGSGHLYKNRKLEQHNERLRIGYLSADFRQHVVMVLLSGVLRKHDRSRYEIHAYSTTVGEDVHDEFRRKAIDYCEYFHDVRPYSDQQLAERIVSDKIDILVDLTGYTHNERASVLALKPAPIIVNWLGYPGTFGVEGLADYIIGDPWVTPIEDEDQFTEKIAQLPWCYLPNDSERKLGRSVTRQEENLPHDAIVLCNFNNAQKLNPFTFDTWCKILKQVSGSVLWMASQNEEVKANILSEAEVRGIGADRIVFATRKMMLEDHISRLSLADIALDTFPYTSHTTGCDALWAGVPLVTYYGNTFVSRVGASLLQSVHLSELIADTWEEYINIVVTLATEKQRLIDIRTKLSDRKSMPLFDTDLFTKNLEGLYEEMWRNFESGEVKHIACQ